MRVFVFYPPGGLFQRGEDRCMIDVKSSTANAMRACNDLGYMASILRNCDDDVFLKDYATEKLTYKDLLDDINIFHPDILVLSTTNTTIYKDIEIIENIFRDTTFKGEIVLKGALFFNAPKELFKIVDLSHISVLIGGEAEWVIKEVIHKTKPMNDIPCIYYKDEAGGWIGTDFTKYNEDLDSIPFPARDLMKNELYVRPDTGEAMATIQAGHGCPSTCIYCLTPEISGKKLRLRSPENVMEELKECYHKYGIKNFFFRADTFTYKRDWVLKLCDLIRKSDLYGHIHYTANSRVKPLTEDVLSAMKDTGCFTIAFGFETGSDETMKKICKGVTVEDNYHAVKMAKKVGIPVFGFFMIGFPWEKMENLEKTKKMIFDLDCDFIEIHVALPYYGTVLYDLCKKENCLAESILGSDIFHASMNGTKYIGMDQMMRFRKKILLRYYMRPKYIGRKLWECKDNPVVIKNYTKYGLRLLRNLVLGGK